MLVDSGIESDNNRRRIEQLRQSYIGFLDPVSLVPQSKLTLNRNNDAYYQNFLVPLARLPQRDIKASEHLLRKAFEWFVDAVRTHQSGKQDGAALARLVDALSDRLFFTVITVTDELNAYKVFETLNARGVRYLLFQLERQLSGAEYDIGSELYSIEYVLPINPGAGWEQFADDAIETLAFRLGNFTLLASADNRDLGNASFATKREVYQASEFAMTHQLAAENTEWNAERIAARQRHMARMATGIWRIDQLS